MVDQSIPASMVAAITAHMDSCPHYHPPLKLTNLGMGSGETARCMLFDIISKRVETTDPDKLGSIARFTNSINSVYGAMSVINNENILNAVVKGDQLVTDDSFPTGVDSAGLANICGFIIENTNFAFIAQVRLKLAHLQSPPGVTPAEALMLAIGDPIAPKTEKPFKMDWMDQEHGVESLVNQIVMRGFLHDDVPRIIPKTPSAANYFERYRRSPLVLKHLRELRMLYNGKNKGPTAPWINFRVPGDEQVKRASLELSNVGIEDQGLSWLLASAYRPSDLSYVCQRITQEDIMLKYQRELMVINAVLQEELPRSVSFGLAAILADGSADVRPMLRVDHAFGGCASVVDNISNLVATGPHLLKMELSTRLYSALASAGPNNQQVIYFLASSGARQQGILSKLSKLWTAEGRLMTSTYIRLFNEVQQSAPVKVARSFGSGQVVTASGTALVLQAPFSFADVARS